MKPLLCALLCALAGGAVQAEVYSRVDPVSGMTVLSNLPQGGAAARPARGEKEGAPAQPAAFPRISGERQKQLDGTRREILETELNNEQKALDAAAARRAAADIVQRHVANVEALKRELAGVR